MAQPSDRYFIAKFDSTHPADKYGVGDSQAEPILGALLQLQQEQQRTNLLLHKLLLPVEYISRCCEALVTEVQKLGATGRRVAALLEACLSSLASLSRHAAAMSALLHSAAAAAARGSLVEAHRAAVSYGMALTAVGCLAAAATVQLPYKWHACAARVRAARQHGWGWGTLAGGLADLAEPVLGLGQLGLGGRLLQGQEQGPAGGRRQGRGWWCDHTGLLCAPTTGGSAGGAGGGGGGGRGWLGALAAGLGGGGQARAIAAPRAGPVSVLACRAHAAGGFLLGALALLAWLLLQAALRARVRPRLQPALASSASTPGTTSGTAAAAHRRPQPRMAAALAAAASLLSGAPATPEPAAQHCPQAPCNHTRQPPPAGSPPLLLRTSPLSALPPGLLLSLWRHSAVALLAAAPAWAAALAALRGGAFTAAAAQLAWHALLPYAVAAAADVGVNDVLAERGEGEGVHGGSGPMAGEVPALGAGCDAVGASAAAAWAGESVGTGVSVGPLMAASLDSVASPAQGTRRRRQPLMAGAWARALAAAAWLYGVPLLAGAAPVVPWPWAAAWLLRAAATAAAGACTASLACAALAAAAGAPARASGGAPAGGRWGPLGRRLGRSAAGQGGGAHDAPGAHTHDGVERAEVAAARTRQQSDPNARPRVGDSPPHGSHMQQPAAAAAARGPAYRPLLCRADARRHGPAASPAGGDGAHGAAPQAPATPRTPVSPCGGHAGTAAGAGALCAGGGAVAAGGGSAPPPRTARAEVATAVAHGGQGARPGLAG